MRNSSCSFPLIAAALLLAPMLYVASYLALVRPQDAQWEVAAHRGIGVSYDGYHQGGDWAWRLYWPLEQIDRRLRPDAWKAEQGLDWGDVPFTSRRVSILPVEPN